MQTKNVYYSAQPERVMVTARGERAVIEFPINVTEVETEEGTQWLAESVYSVETVATADLKSRVEQNYEAWLEVAKIIEPQKASIDDVVDALNALTDMILGGE